MTQAALDRAALREDIRRWTAEIAHAPDWARAASAAVRNGWIAEARYVLAQVNEPRPAAPL